MFEYLFGGNERIGLLINERFGKGKNCIGNDGWILNFLVFLYYFLFVILMENYEKILDELVIGILKEIVDLIDGSFYFNIII